MGRNDRVRDIIRESNWKGKDCPRDIINDILSARESLRDIINNQQEGIGRRDRPQEIVSKRWSARDRPREIVHKRLSAKEEGIGRRNHVQEFFGRERSAAWKETATRIDQPEGRIDQKEGSAKRRDYLKVTIRQN
eukprot:10541734-Ditylum_brightwellii.AAC.1